MKLNNSYSTSHLFPFLGIHIVIIQVIFFHLTISQATNPQPTSDTQDVNYYEISDENKKLIMNQVKANLLKVLNLKEVPREPRKKVYVPHAMLEEYRNLRNSVRHTIPDDRDFYGKINIDDLDQTHDDFWSAVYNRYGGYDIGIEMDPEDTPGIHKKFIYKGDAKPLLYVTPQSDPEDVSPKIEHLLPPHSRSTESQKQFISVHLRFNLSQELSIKPLTADELRAAELHLSRERIYDCEFNNCDRRSASFHSRDTIESPKVANNVHLKNEDGKIEKATSSREKSLQEPPRYQRLYILQILDYDKFNEPITKIHTSLRIDTRQSFPLMFDIYHIIKSWLKNPSKNYGLIVRVTNEDNEPTDYQPSTSSASKQTNDTNASSRILSKRETLRIGEHVRLKREFRSSSESDDSWARKQPGIFLFADVPDSTKRHVKRDHSGSSEEAGMQADDPDAATSESGNNNPVQQSNQTTEDSQYSDNPTEVNSPTTAPPKISNSRNRPTGSGNPFNRRDSRQTYETNQQSRSSNSGARSLTGPRAKIKNRPATEEKCAMKLLLIEFDKIGWSNWIIAPTNYYANYCAGDCSFPMNDHHNATNHAIIQSIYHSAGRVVPRSCCAPTKLGQMAILYQLDGTVQMRHYDGMTVESCGCL